MALIAVDFDGTIRDWDTNEPIEGAKDAMCALREKRHKILIHSCNNRDFIRQWMNDANIPFDIIWNGLGKPAADAYIDDRGVAFRGDWKASIKETLELVGEK